MFSLNRSQSNFFIAFYFIHSLNLRAFSLYCALSLSLSSTADAIRYRSTTDILEEFLDRGRKDVVTALITAPLRPNFVM